MKQLEKFLRRYENKIFNISLFLVILLLIAFVYNDLLPKLADIINNNEELNRIETENMVCTLISIILLCIMKAINNIYVKFISFFGIICFVYYCRILIFGFLLFSIVLAE